MTNRLKIDIPWEDAVQRMLNAGPMPDKYRKNKAYRVRSAMCGNCPRCGKPCYPFGYCEYHREDQARKSKVRRSRVPVLYHRPKYKTRKDKGVPRPKRYPRVEGNLKGLAMSNENGVVRQGWECPVCYVVWGPDVKSCETSHSVIDAANTLARSIKLIETEKVIPDPKITNRGTRRKQLAKGTLQRWALAQGDRAITSKEAAKATGSSKDSADMGMRRMVRLGLFKSLGHATYQITPKGMKAAASLPSGLWR